MGGNSIDYPIIDLYSNSELPYADNLNYWFYRAFGYNGRYIFIDFEGKIRAHIGPKDYIRGWSSHLALHHLPTPIITATTAWHKSQYAIPLAEFLRIMFNQQDQIIQRTGALKTYESPGL